MKKNVLSGDENPISAVIIDEESLDRLFLENGTLDHQKIESTFQLTSCWLNIHKTWRLYSIG